MPRTIYCSMKSCGGPSAGHRARCRLRCAPGLFSAIRKMRMTIEWDGWLALLDLFDRRFHFTQMGIGARDIGHVRDFTIQADEKTHSARHGLVCHLSTIGFGDLSIRVR